MTLFKHILRFLRSKYSIALTLLLVGFFVLFQWVIPHQLPKENVTWIYSSSMQTLAALIALLPISYGYYVNNLDSEKNEDIDTYVINKLKQDVYYDMMTVILYSLLVIVINLTGFFISTNQMFSLIIALLTIEGIGFISIYIYRLFDPNRVKEVFKEFDTVSDQIDVTNQISLDTFITKYLELETTIKDFISNENDSELVDTLPLYDIVDNLSKDFPEIEEHYHTFKEIIFHRNNVIHNYTDTVVDYKKYESILELIDLFDKRNNQFIQKNIFGNVVRVKNIVETCLNEFVNDMQNKQVDHTSLPEDFKEEITSLLHSYFISDYFITRSLEDAQDCDFEVIQNNYSERKLVGIDVKSIVAKNLQKIATSYFDRLSNRFLYLFLINYNVNTHSFVIMYRTKDKDLRTVVIKNTIN